MSGTIGFILGSHNHIPYGIGDDEFEGIYNSKLRPFITALNKYPKIPATLHYSGVLLHWIERNHPEFFMLVVDMVSRKQVEMLGGGFYEPLLPLLPLADKIGQVEMLTTYLRRHFNKRPQGCWLPALAWDQSMVGVLNTCGMGYTFMNETLFAAAGLPEDALYAPCISEDQGKLVTVFPLSDRLNREFQRKRASEVLEALAAAVPPGQNRFVAVFPEFFFTGPEPSPEGRINRFLEDLSQAESRGEVELTSPGRLFKNLNGLAKAYFPSSVQERKYPAATELSEDPPGEETPAPLLVRQFLITYPEANGIYSKMMFTHVLINQLRGDKSRKRTAREELWKAQGCDAFCYGAGGGIYRNTLRNAAYKALLGAEKITREKGVFIPSLMNFDFDLDGEDEYLFQGEQINCYIKSRGAAVFELDYLPKTWNYLDTLARGRETPSPGTAGVEDRYRRAAFADRLVPPGLSCKDAAAGRFLGGRFCAGERYDLLELDKTRGKALFRLPPRGDPSGDLPFGSLEIEKTFSLKKNQLSLRYCLANRGEKPEEGRFLSAVDLALPGEGPLFQRIFAPRPQLKEALGDGTGELPDTAAVEIQDLKNEVIINLSSDRNFDAWIYPVRTRCRINGRVADHYQSTCVTLVRPISLAPGESLEFEFRLRLNH